jgi:hypothetical protein
VAHPSTPNDPATQVPVLETPAKGAAVEAYAQARSARERREARRNILEAIVGLTAPPLIGIGILIVVFSGNASAAIEHSAAATSTALIVAALLILVPPVIFAFSPDRYSEYQTANERRLRELVTGHDD